MKVCFLIFIIFLAVTAQPAIPQQAEKPLTKDQVMGLVNFGMDGADLARRIKERGVDFEPTEDYVESLKRAGAENMVVQALVRSSALGQESGRPLTKDQVVRLVKFGMDGTEVAKRIKGRGLDFEPTDDYLETLREAGGQAAVIRAIREVKPKPLTQEQIGKLVAGGVPSQRAAALVKQRGIDFLADEQYFEMLRLAGGDDVVIAAVREAGVVATAQLAVETSPGAEVYLDSELQGRASAQGELAVKAKLGAHALRVSLKGKKDFEQSVMFASTQPEKIEARLEDAPGSIRLLTLAGASVSLDAASRGSTDVRGELVLSDVPPGAHELRISARGKVDHTRTVTVAAAAQVRVGVALIDVPPPGTVRGNSKDGLKYVWIPPGTSIMGCSPGDSECYPNEKPSHKVIISKGFWIGQTETTVSAYKRFVAATGRQMPHAPSFNSGWTNENMPVVKVSWDDAQAYCGWAGGRLPTEAEWEYAARGGSSEARYGNLDEIAWYRNNSGGQAHEVAQKRANGFGLFDMLGNVLEWVNDWYDENYYRMSPSQDPTGAGSGQYRVLRGGSWDGSWGDSRELVRVSSRTVYYPTSRIDNGGFRCGGEVGSP
jgi:formylglycine-generating enzyme required for sulfatase activity